MANYIALMDVLFTGCRSSWGAVERGWGSSQTLIKWCIAGHVSPIGTGSAISPRYQCPKHRETLAPLNPWQSGRNVIQIFLFHSRNEYIKTVLTPQVQFSLPKFIKKSFLKKKKKKVCNLVVITGQSLKQCYCSSPSAEGGTKTG